MSDQSYNGWTNYETWNVKLWMDNDQGTQQYWREAAQDAWDNAAPEEHLTRQQRAKFNLADRLKEEHYEAMADMLEESKQDCSVWADLLGAALSQVNWDEIAANMMSEVNRDDE